MSEISADVEKHVRRISKLKGSLAQSSAIYHDLHISGDDATELLEDLIKSYGTSFDGFTFSEYFPNETEGSWFYLDRLFGWPGNKRKILTFGHLIAVVEQGAWFEPFKPSL